MNARQAKSFVRKMRISSNMILLIQEGSPIAEKAVIDTLAKTIDSMGIKNVVVIVVKDFDRDIRALDRHAMAKHGWFFADDMNRLMRSKKDATPTV